MKSRTLMRWFAAAVVVVWGRGATRSQAEFWQRVTGPNGDTVYSIAINASGTIFATTPEGMPEWASGRVARSSDDGLTWTLSNNVLADRFAFSSNGTVWCAGRYGVVYRSTDNGSSWRQTSYPGQGVNALAVNDSGFLFAGWGESVGAGGGIFRSTDNGASWVDVGLRATSNVMAISAEGTIFSGGWKPDGACVFRSTNNGSTWTSTGFRTTSLTDRVEALAIGSFGEIYVGTHLGIFHSWDNGASWLRSTSDMSHGAACFAVKGDTIFAGPSMEGLWCSTDGGDNWWTSHKWGLNPDNDRFPLFVRALATNPNGTVYAATSKGLFRSLQTSSVTDVHSGAPTKFALEQNYPNPFNPSTKIGFRIQELGFSTLKVFDMLGRAVATLVNEELKPGSYEITFDATWLASGMYFYRLESGKFVETKKLSFLR